MTDDDVRLADEARRKATLLAKYLGFTPDQAARYVAGDRTAIEAVAARRIAEDTDTGDDGTVRDDLRSAS